MGWVKVYVFAYMISDVIWAQQISSSDFKRYLHILYSGISYYELYFLSKLITYFVTKDVIFFLIFYFITSNPGLIILKNTWRIKLVIIKNPTSLYHFSALCYKLSYYRVLKICPTMLSPKSKELINIISPLLIYRYLVSFENIDKLYCDLQRWIYLFEICKIIYLRTISIISMIKTANN